ncbi:MAG: hypothetical protein DMG49_19645 [Acidobacteria bacterium]|nr:MAG: hypothetical protein DMG49_19645 [Acidobacteriota bacterium]
MSDRGSTARPWIRSKASIRQPSISPILIHSLTENFGWHRAFEAIGVSILAVLFPVGTSITRSAPREMSLQGYGGLRFRPYYSKKRDGLIPFGSLFIGHNSEAVYGFAVVFGFAMGADYMLISLVVADCFGLTSLEKLLALIVMADSLGQTYGP